jgi:subtilisin family serine protease
MIRFTAKNLIALATLVFVALGCLPAVSALAAGNPPAPVGEWGRLRSIAQAHGGVPVIVELNTAGESRLVAATGKRDVQRQDVARARATLLHDLHGVPGGLKTADEMPLVAFTADSDDLAALQQSSAVRSVAEDRSHAMDAEKRPASRTGAIATPAASTDGQEQGVAGTSSAGTYGSLKPWWDFYRVGAQTAHDNGWTGKGQTVAVIDTGVARNHPWLDGRVVNEACFSNKSNCPNRSTYQYGYGAAAPCSYHWLCRHGTHTAHTAAGMYGIANQATIMAISVFSKTSSGPQWSDSDLVWGLRHVYENRGAYNIASINLSLGGARYRGYCDNASDLTESGRYIVGWINALKDVGIATVGASGNGDDRNGIGRPSCSSNVISVGNTTKTSSGKDAVYGNIEGGSNSNTTLDLLAPGTDVCSAIPRSLETDGTRDGIDCDAIGTSMAAPHVAGAPSPCSASTAPTPPSISCWPRCSSRGRASTTPATA